MWNLKKLKKKNKKKNRNSTSTLVLRSLGLFKISLQNTYYATAVTSAE